MQVSGLAYSTRLACSAGSACFACFVIGDVPHLSALTSQRSPLKAHISTPNPARELDEKYVAAGVGEGAPDLIGYAEVGGVERYFALLRPHEEER
jgi:hypothetical protein